MWNCGIVFVVATSEFIAMLSFLALTTWGIFAVLAFSMLSNSQGRQWHCVCFRCQRRRTGDREWASVIADGSDFIVHSFMCQNRGSPGQRSHPCLFVRVEPYYAVPPLSGSDFQQSLHGSEFMLLSWPYGNNNVVTPVEYLPLFYLLHFLTTLLFG